MTSSQPSVGGRLTKTFQAGQRVRLPGEAVLHTVEMAAETPQGWQLSSLRVPVRQPDHAEIPASDAIAATSRHESPSPLASCGAAHRRWGLRRQSPGRKIVCASLRNRRLSRSFNKHQRWTELISPTSASVVRSSSRSCSGIASSGSRTVAHSRTDRMTSASLSRAR
jgi:hypothetical protein